MLGVPMRPEVGLDAAEDILLELAGVQVGHSVLERLWTESLILRDLTFLQDSAASRLERKMVLLHDLCPLTNRADERKLGHMTAAYRNKKGERMYHTLKAY